MLCDSDESDDDHDRCNGLQGQETEFVFLFSFFVSHMMDSPWLVQLSCSFRNASTSYEITRLGAVIDFYTRDGTW